MRESLSMTDMGINFLSYELAIPAHAHIRTAMHATIPFSLPTNLSLSPLAYLCH